MRHALRSAATRIAWPLPMIETTVLALALVVWITG